MMQVKTLMCYTIINFHKEKNNAKLATRVTAVKNIGLFFEFYTASQLKTTHKNKSMKE